MFESITLPIGHYRSSILFLKFAKYHAAPHSFAIKYLFTAYSDITPANLADRVREKVNHQSNAQQISYGICGAHGRMHHLQLRPLDPAGRSNCLLHDNQSSHDMREPRRRQQVIRCTHSIRG